MRNYKLIFCEMASIIYLCADKKQRVSYYEQCKHRYSRTPIIL